MRDVYAFQKQKVKLDVGGHRFSTSRATLLSVPGSFLAAMFSGSYALEKDEDDGSFFIDRDGRYFHHILNYLVCACISVRACVRACVRARVTGS